MLKHTLKRGMHVNYNGVEYIVFCFMHGGAVSLRPVGDGSPIILCEDICKKDCNEAVVNESECKRIVKSIRKVYSEKYVGEKSTATVSDLIRLVTCFITNEYMDAEITKLYLCGGVEYDRYMSLLECHDFSVR